MSGDFVSYMPREGSAPENNHVSLSVNDVDALDGEIVNVWCEHVLKYNPNDESSASGQLGTVSCSQYRLVFVAHVQQAGACCSRSLVFHDNNDIPWKMVNQILYSDLEDPRLRLMNAVLSFSEKPSKLKFILNDWRVVEFDFSTSSGQVSSKDVANYAYQFSFASGPAFYKSPKSLMQPRKCNKTSWFVNRHDWMELLEQTGAKMRGWRVAEFNHDYVTMPTYPPCIVVPSRCNDAQLIYSAPHWKMNRMPVWCWSDVESGCSLIRAAELCIEDSKEMDMYIAACRDCHPKRLAPEIVNVTYDLSSIQKSHNSLRDLCMQDSVSNYNECDRSWLRKLGETEWMSVLSVSLRLTRDVVDHIVAQKSVIIQESCNRDMSCVVSSLAQICVHPYYRTIDGFYSLLAKEWIALGHPFALRIFGQDRNEYNAKEKSCVLLVLLDCISQLMLVHPCAFEFTQHLLIGLWDVCIGGLADCMSANQLRDIFPAPVDHIKEQPSVPWPLTDYFNSNYCATHINPAYWIVSPKRNRTPILPPNCILALNFWHDHYLRWNVLAQKGPVHITRTTQRLQAGGNIIKQLTIAQNLKSFNVRALHPLPNPRNVVSNDYPYMYLERIDQKGLQFESKPKSKPTHARNMSTSSRMSISSVDGLNDSFTASTSVGNSSFLPYLRDKLADVSMNRGGSLPRKDSISTEV